MKPLVVLVIVFILSLCGIKIIAGNWNTILSGNIAMCIMLCFTALGHFKFTEGMAMMIPPVVPFKRSLVYFTGIAEIVFGVGLLFIQTRYVAGILVVVFLAKVLPANIYAAMKYVNFEKADYTGKGPNYLWFRIPLQLFLIAWVLYFSIY